MTMNISEISLTLTAGGTSQKLTVAALGTQQSAAAAASSTESKGVPIPYVITADAVCFVRKGSNPTAAPDTDQYLVANQSYRVELMDGEKMSFYSTAGCNVYITPRA
jgi:hypothetical protein